LGAGTAGFAAAAGFTVLGAAVLAVVFGFFAVVVAVMGSLSINPYGIVIHVLETILQC
jgi:nitrogen fixation protein FixH